MHKEILLNQHKLIHAEIEIFRLCNHNCIFCFSNGQSKSVLKDSNMVETNKLFPINRLISLINELKNMGVKAISFTGAGEPLLHPDINEILMEVINNDIEFGITTNLNIKLSKETLELLKEAAWIRCSINAPDEKSYKKIHNPQNNLTIETTLDNIRYLVKEGVPIDISFVVFDENYKYIIDSIKLAGNLGVKSISFRPVIESLKRGDNRYPDYVKKILKNAKYPNLIVNSGLERLKDSSEIKENIPCYYSNFSVFISTSGNVYPCCVSIVDYKYCYGNIMKSNFIDFWNKSNKQYEKINMRYCPGCAHTEDNKILHMLYNGNINNFI